MKRIVKYEGKKKIVIECPEKAFVPSSAIIEPRKDPKKIKKTEENVSE